jgi:membrane fusion protein, peptide pheromone/bacteriocin exporter
MKNQILPVEVLENSAATYLPKVTVRSRAIYTTILFSIIGLFILMPIIKVDVTVASSGQVISEFGRSEVTSLSSGILSEVKIKDNDVVKKDQPLFIIASSGLDGQLTSTSIDLEEKEKYIEDLDQMIVNSNSAAPQTSLYRQELQFFKRQLQIKQKQKSYAYNDLMRARELYANKSYAKIELEKAEGDYNRIDGDLQSFQLEKLYKWQSDLAVLRSETRGLQSKAQQMNEQKGMSVIKASMAGSIQLRSGKTAGSSIQIGEVLATLSPDSNLLAECYVSPRDIGLIREGMKVKFQVDAFNYNEWGMISGQVADVAKDFVIEQQNQPIYKIKCKLDKKELQLKNGYTGKLKKGMSMRGIFVVTRRSLMQLLYDNVDDWLNPVNGKPAPPAK